MKLIPDWRKAWKLFSVKASLVSAAFMASWPMLPDDLKAAMPGLNIVAASAFGLIFFVRLVDQNKGV